MKENKIKFVKAIIKSDTITLKALILKTPALLTELYDDIQKYVIAALSEKFGTDNPYIDKKFYDNISAELLSVRYSKPEILALLIEFGINYDDIDTLSESLLNFNLDTAKYLIDNNFDKKLLHNLYSDSNHSMPLLKNLLMHLLETVLNHPFHPDSQILLPKIIKLNLHFMDLNKKSYNKSALKIESLSQEFKSFEAQEVHLDMIKEAIEQEINAISSKNKSINNLISSYRDLIIDKAQQLKSKL